MPPTTVLIKLSSCPLGENEDGLENKALRKRCYSESHTKLRQKSSEKINTLNVNKDNIRGSSPLQRRMSTTPPRMFALESSITKSTEQLGRIREELHTVNEDLVQVVEYKNKYMSKDEFQLDAEDDYFSIVEVSRNAQQDLRMAYLASMEFREILAGLETAWNCEEKDIVSRAGWLRRESETIFEKMSPSAIKKMSGSPQQSDSGSEGSLASSV